MLGQRALARQPDGPQGLARPPHVGAWAGLLIEKALHKTGGLGGFGVGDYADLDAGALLEEGDDGPGNIVVGARVEDDTVVRSVAPRAGGQERAHCECAQCLDRSASSKQRSPALIGAPPASGAAAQVYRRDHFFSESLASVAAGLGAREAPSFACAALLSVPK